MKYLGIDYGAKRIGIAVSNAEGTIAFPRVTIQNGAGALAEIARLARGEHVEAVIIGDARSYGGAENPITKDADALGSALAEELSVRVQSVFEVATSVEARQYAPKGREHDDAAAAAVILQRFLDMKGRSGERSQKLE